MICPLQSTAVANPDFHGQVDELGVRCDEKNCAWWDTESNQCCIKTLASASRAAARNKGGD